MQQLTRQPPSLPSSRFPLVHLQHLGFHPCESQSFASPGTTKASDRQRLISFYMVNYYIKYVELIDTVFLVLKKKPLGESHLSGGGMRRV